MTTREEILASVDSRIAMQMSVITTVQTNYLASNGHYAQGLPLVSEIPADGAEVAPDRADVSPTDQSESWADLAPIPPTVMSQPRIDTYAGPDGPGYVCSFRVEIAGDIWERSVNVGPETGREKAWAITTEDA